MLVERLRFADDPAQLGCYLTVFIIAMVFVSTFSDTET